MDTDTKGLQAANGECGEWRAESGERRVESGEWRAESGERRVESGEWRAGGGERETPHPWPLSPSDAERGTTGEALRAVQGAALSRAASGLGWNIGIRLCFLLLLLLVSFGRIFEDEAEADDEEDSVPVNFQTGFHVRLPRNHFTKKERPPLPAAA